MESFYQNESATIYFGDSLVVLADLADNSVDALVTDPPAGVSFMARDWDTFKGDIRQADEVADSEAKQFRRSKIRYGDSAGYGNKSPRSHFVAALTPIFQECLRVMKPGAHGLVWSLPRTSHWTAWALEEAGFEIRDRVAHLFGSGFPKSLNVERSIDTHLCELPGRHYWNEASTPKGDKALPDDHLCLSTDAGQEHSKEGTALKPACEDWWLVRKPLNGTVAANVLTYGTGALNIDDCRVDGANGDGHWSGDDGSDVNSRPGYEGGFTKGGKVSRPLRVVAPLRDDYDYDGQSLAGRVDGSLRTSKAVGETTVGRWPANVITDGSDEVLAAFPNAPGQLRALTGKETPKQGTDVYGDYGPRPACDPRDDFGSAARFFYTAKASKEDREEGLEDLAARQQDESRKEGNPGGDNPRNRGLKKRANHHPTVKPVALMRYLCRLITQPGGVVLDPFMGSGSTGKAAYLEGLRFIGIDKDRSYCEIAARRCELRQRSLFAINE